MKDRNREAQQGEEVRTVDMAPMSWVRDDMDMQALENLSNENKSWAGSSF
jgi:hypothetical protein